MSRLFHAALAALSLAVVLGLPATVRAADPPKVAIIVGPVGSLTPTYLALAERAAASALAHGATVARAYSPHATPGNVLAAVEGANVIVYFGHGYGHPSPYGGLNTAKQNGWALQGPQARGTHGDASGQVAYYGEDWIVANARPAPGFVMIYSNTCYAPGASEPGHAPATAWQAAQRVASYSRATFTMGGSAYFATDFDAGAADLVDRILRNRSATYGSAFVSDRRYIPSALTTQAHHYSAGQQIWLHRSKYTDGPPNYWYGFAGNPDLTPLRAWDRVAPTARPITPKADATDVVPGATLKVELSEAVTGVSASTVLLRDADGDAVPAEVSYDAASQVATIDPTSPLELSSRYELAVGKGIRDAAGRALAPVSWWFSTRVDADPLTAPVPIVLESGTHELVRFGPDGSVAATKTVEVRQRYWLAADRRARLQAQTGSWLRLSDPVHEGWWIGESAAAHALGQVEEAILAPSTPLNLAPVEHALHGFGPDGPQPIGLAVSATQVHVDRRVVVEGRTYLRLADTAYAGAWIEVDPAMAVTEAAAGRLLGTESAPSKLTVVLDGERAVFRFDSAGRVVDRRILGADDGLSFTSEEAQSIGGARFLVIADGDLAGWALREEAGVNLLIGSPAAAAD